MTNSGYAPRLKSSLPNFVFEVDDNVFAQTSEITIHLEKKIRPAEETFSSPDGLTPDEDTGQRSWKLDLNDFHAPEGQEYNDDSGAGSLSYTPSSDGEVWGESDGFADFDSVEDPFAVNEPDIPPLEDPYEGYNRFMYAVNDTIYDYFMEPVARGYRYVIPEEGRIAIRNIFDNALAPVKLVSSLVQGDLDKSGRVLGRFLINTTVGLGGMLDVAGQEYQIENVNEDFDQALGYHDMPPGPYIILPFFGPSTGRGVVGRVVDTVLNPLFLLDAGFVTGASLTVTEKTNEVSFIVDDIEALDETAIDEYESVRDFFHQYREGLVRK
jgi:phospholipid-binding lipoprotein MlaA